MELASTTGEADQQIERMQQRSIAVFAFGRKEKTVNFDNGRVYLTSHRLLYIDANQPFHYSRSLELADIKQTEYWAGFLKSSAKITLVLGESGSATPDTPGTPRASLDGNSKISHNAWACHVCGYRNSASGSKCTLCGVVRSSDGPASLALSPQSPGPSNSQTDPKDAENLLACPTCTYLNHLSMSRCELCESPLTTSGSTFKIARPGTPVEGPRPATPVFGAATPTVVRLSFRKGGDKPFYAALKLALKTKAWTTMVYESRARREQASSEQGDPVMANRATTFGISEYSS